MNRITIRDRNNKKRQVTLDPETFKAVGCLFEYMKCVHRKSDLSFGQAIKIYLNETGYKIPIGMSQEDWITDLYQSGLDSNINKDGIYTDEAVRAHESARRKAVIFRKLESLSGLDLAILEHYEDMERVRYEQRAEDVDPSHLPFDRFNKASHANLSRRDKYLLYISSDQWRDLKQSIVDDRGMMCQECMTRGPVDAHHLTYDRLFEEVPEDIELLCRECHYDRHPEKKKPSK